MLVSRCSSTGRRSPPTPSPWRGHCPGAGKTQACGKQTSPTSARVESGPCSDTVGRCIAGSKERTCQSEPSSTISMASSRDSEALANIVLAEHVTALGLPTTLEDALTRYMGKRWNDFLEIVEAELGEPLPSGFSDDLRSSTLARFASDLREVEGAAEFIRRFDHLPRCIASSSSLDRLELCLEVLGLRTAFDGAVLSADMVSRGKPHPDIFLLASERLGVPPAACLVIEDSPSGVRAGVAAGMSVLGLCAGSHIRDGHADRLREARSSSYRAVVGTGFLDRS